MKPGWIIIHIILGNLFNSVVPHCWKPSTNPFLGVPEVQRIDSTSVRIFWYNVFPNGTGCNDIDFLIKSHPLHTPSNYKLSDFTLRGQRSATLTVPPGTDFIFQVIARENKGTELGIEYAYSRPATSLSNPSEDQKETLRQSIWVAGGRRVADSSSRSGNSGGNYRSFEETASVDRPPPRPQPGTPPTRPPPVQRVFTTRPPSAGPRPTASTSLLRGPVDPPASVPRGPVDPPASVPRGSVDPPASVPRRPVDPPKDRVYTRPMLKSLDSNPDYYNGSEEEADANPWYIYECVPLLKNMAGLQDGSEKNSILKKYIRHMNGNAVHSVKEFIGSNKSCKKDKPELQRGHLVETEGTNRCCTTPWGDNSPNSVCYDQFARCDGQCIPNDWVADGWPDCMDGADEANMAVEGKVLPYQLGCVHCAGVILSAGFLCREASGLTRTCVENILGPGECNVCIGEYMNLP